MRVITVIGASLLLILAGCATTGGSSASERANIAADNFMYQPVAYANAATPGPSVVVLPGDIKSANVYFMTKVTANNIADFAELELSQANFKVLERTDLGPLLYEVQLAANMGDAASLKKFRKGKFETTRWFLEFDILKAEPVAQASSGFSGRYFGNVISALAGQSTGGQVAGTAVGSVETSDAAQIWIVGMRYKILDAQTTEQVATGYVEGKMEVGANATSVMGISQSESGGVGLDTMTQRLVQQCVMEIDANNK